MKRLLFLCCFILISTISIAQSQFPPLDPAPKSFNQLKVGKIFWLNTTDTIGVSAVSYPGAIIYRQQPGDTSHYRSNGVKWSRFAGDPDLSNYYTKTQLQTSGQAAVHLDNVTGLRDSLNAIKVKVVSDVGDLANFGPADSVIFVLDSLRGGTFIWQSSGIVDNGETFPGATGYYIRQYQQSMGRSVAWYGARPDDGSDDTAPIQAAINSSAKTNIFFPFGEYHLTSITFNKAIENVDGRGSTIIITGSDTAAIIVPLTVYFHDFLIKKDPACTTPVAIRISGSRCYVENITGTGPFANFFDCYAMRESHFRNLRIDNDTTNYTGVVFRLNSVINNTISNSQFSFGDTCFFLTAAQHPIYNYRTEGLNITNCVTTLFNWACVIDWGTQIMITDNVFDFNREGGIFQSNGKSTTIQGNWIAGWDANGFLGVGTTNGVTGGSITGNQIHAGASPITGAAFQITGLNYIVSNNYYADIDGGVITDPSSQVYGNTYTNGTGISLVSGSTQANNGFQVMKYGMTGGEPAGTEYSINGFTLTTTGGSVYKSGVKYHRGAFSDLIQQRFFVASGGGAETDVLTLDGNTSSVGIKTTAPTSTLDVAGPNGFNQFRLRTQYTPSSSGDVNGATGDIAVDDNYIYFKTSTGWKRSPLTTFNIPFFWLLLLLRFKRKNTM